MFGVTGAGLSKIKHMQNGGKRARRSIDQWDRQSTDMEEEAISGNADTSVTVMERDRRLTGMLRGQTDSPIAPDGFELSNAWKVSAAPSDSRIRILTCSCHLDGEEIRIETRPPEILVHT